MKAMANVNGIITPLEEARISVLDRGFLYGDSIYEVVRTYNGTPFFFDEHCDRLENSARLARIKITQSRAQLTDEIKKTIAAAEPNNDVYVRYAITRGIGAIDLDPATAKETGFVIFVKEIPNWNIDFYRAGMKIAVPRTRRNSPQCVDPNIKSGNYLNNVLAVAEAKELGADDALMLSLDDRLTECSNSNILFVVDGKIISPLHDPASSTGNLKGLTKLAISQICTSHKIPYVETALRESDLTNATECFVSSATREIMPVREIRWTNGKKQEFPTGGGKLTQHLQSLYKDYINHYVLTKKLEPWFKC